MFLAYEFWEDSNPLVKGENLNKAMKVFVWLSQRLLSQFYSFWIA